MYLVRVLPLVIPTLGFPPKSVAMHGLPRVNQKVTFSGLIRRIFTFEVDMFFQLSYEV